MLFLKICTFIFSIEKLKEFHPDVLLLDINMPEKNGIEVLKELKKAEKPKQEVTQGEEQ